MARQPAKGKGARATSSRRDPKRVAIYAVLGLAVFLVGLSGGALLASRGPEQDAPSRQHAPSRQPLAVAPAREMTPPEAAAPTPIPLPETLGRAAAPPPPSTVAPAAAPREPPASVPQVAALPPPRAPAPPASLRPPGGAAPLVAIVIDDAGVDRRRSARAIRLPAPLTIAFLPYADDLPEQAAEAGAAGHELLLHLPMEPSSDKVDPGPNVLSVAEAPAETVARLERSLARFSGFIGVNNHMGSRFTESAVAMRPVLEALRAHGLAFLDSRTSPRSVALEVAAEIGLPAIGRDVFLDNTDSREEVRRRLAQTEEIARRHGTAVAIGHPRDNTLAELEAWLPEAARRGLALVPVSRVFEARLGGAPIAKARP